MTIAEVWEKHTFQVLLADLFKARKDPSMGQMRLKVLVDYLAEQGLGAKPSQAVSVSETKAEPELAAEVDDEKIPLAPSPFETAQDRYDRFTAELTEKLKGKAGVFALEFDVNYPVNDIPIMLDNLRLPLVCPEGAQLLEGIKTQRPLPGGGPMVTERGEDRWRVLFHPKQ